MTNWARHGTWRERLIIGSGSDLFQALQEIRFELYVLQFGRQVEREHLTTSFAEAEPHSLGTVEQQQNYYRDWRLSLAVSDQP